MLRNIAYLIISLFFVTSSFAATESIVDYGDSGQQAPSVATSAPTPEEITEPSKPISCEEVGMVTIGSQGENMVCEKDTSSGLECFKNCQCPPAVSLDGANDTCEKTCGSDCIEKSCKAEKDVLDCASGITSCDDGCGGMRICCR